MTTVVVFDSQVETIMDFYDFGLLVCSSKRGMQCGVTVIRVNYGLGGNDDVMLFTISRKSGATLDGLCVREKCECETFVLILS
jgi:hypothetical protein